MPESGSALRLPLVAILQLEVPREPVPPCPLALVVVQELGLN